MTAAPILVVESLKLRNMTRSARGTAQSPGTRVRQKAGLNRALLDAAPGRLLSMLRYKAESAGGRVEVDPRGTSQTCPACNAAAPKTLGVRWHSCPCGAEMHRDHAAALVIKARGLEVLREEARAAHGAARRPGEPNVADYGVRAPGTPEEFSGLPV